MILFAVSVTAIPAGACAQSVAMSPSPAASDASTNILVFPAAFFADAQPVNAYDIVVRVPGFLFSTGDADVRGLAGANGNVLIDGIRPTAKDDTLDAVLKRIPASAVLRVELIRGGANGIDMQGQPLLANVVRRTDAATRGKVEANLGRYGDGRTTPSLQADISRQGGGKLTEGSVYLYQSIDDEKGYGPRIRTNADGSLREKAHYDEQDGFRGGQMTAGHERGLAGGRLHLAASLKREREISHTDLSYLAPDPGLERVDERETKDNAELGLDWTRTLSRHLSLELIGLQRFSRNDASERSDDGTDANAVSEKARGGESVGRAIVRWQPISAFSLEGGGEAAYNYLNSRSALSINGQPVALPAANVRVAERRGEIFATAVWHIDTPLTLETGVRVESSRLKQTGDSRLEKSFIFPKPHMLLSWSAGPRTQIRLRIERTVGQLDFADFVSSTSLTSSTITAGNADLEPDRRWVASLAWERRFWGEGALVITARHEWISHTLDRVGIVGANFAFDAPGNIGDGSKDKIDASLSLPLDRLGIAGGLLKGDVGYRRTSVTDPTTRQHRRISDEEPIDGEVHFTQDRPAIGFRWGIDMLLTKTEYQYRFDEIRRTGVGARLSTFLEYRLSPLWTLRAYVENITGRHVDRTRTIYDGPRDAYGLRYVETRDLATHPLAGVLLRRRFGI